MDILAAYREVDTYRGAADICGTTHKTVKRVIVKAEAGDQPVQARPVPVPVYNYDSLAELVATRVATWQGRISAKRLLPIAVTAGYEGSLRNFRRLVAAPESVLA